VEGTQDKAICPPWGVREEPIVPSPDPSPRGLGTGLGACAPWHLGS
jgi:hypothetical protein